MGWNRRIGAAAVVLVVVGCSPDPELDPEEQQGASMSGPWPVRVTSAVEVAYLLQESDALGEVFAAYEIAVEIAAPSGDPGPCRLATDASSGVSRVTVTLTNTDDGSATARGRNRVPYLEAGPVGDVGPLLWAGRGECVEEVDTLLEDWSFGQEQTVTGYLGQVPLGATYGDGLGVELHPAAPYWEIVDGYAEPLQVVV